MIVVTLEYDQNFLEELLESDGALDGNAALDWVLQEFRDSVEAIVGLVFQEALDRVDVRIKAFGPYDEYEEPVFITVDFDTQNLPPRLGDLELYEGAKRMCQEFLAHFGTHIDAYLPEHIRFRVWVRRINGSFAETATTVNNQEVE